MHRCAILKLWDNYNVILKGCDRQTLKILFNKMLYPKEPTRDNSFIGMTLKRNYTQNDTHIKEVIIDFWSSN